MKYLLTGQETERLKFRLLKKEDFDSWVALFKAKNIAKYLDLDPKLGRLKKRSDYKIKNQFGEVLN